MVRNSDLVNGTFTAIVGTIYQQAIASITHWIIAITAVILCDLFTGMRKAWLLNEELRWSKGLRCTMSKWVQYLAFVIGAVLVEVACGNEFPIAQWCCLLVCAIEGLSIIGNVLKPHGITISVKGIMHAIGSKTNIDLDQVVKSENSKPKKTKK